MPRTKRVSKKRNYSNVSDSKSSEGKSEKNNVNDEMMIVDINRNFDAQLAKIDKQLENSIQLLRQRYDMLIMKIPSTMLNQPPNWNRNRSSGFGSSSSTVSLTVDHSSPTKIPGIKPKRWTEQMIGNSSKSSDDSDEQAQLMPPPMHSRFRTPNCNIGAGGKYNVITPKMQPNSVLSVLRRPREGEMAVSMSGSPLFVSSISHENMANVNVPLPNGSIMSILPQAGLRPHDLPEVDEETMKQLKQLQDNLSSFLNIKF